MIRRNPPSSKSHVGSDQIPAPSAPTTTPLNGQRHARRRRDVFGVVMFLFLILIWRVVLLALPFGGGQDSVVVHHPTLLEMKKAATTLPIDYHEISFRPIGKVDVNVSIVKRTEAKCRNNAIVLLAQKKHATYNRDSYGLLVKSLKLISKNYLSRNQHDDNVDVFLFHTGDFDWRDVEYLEPLIGDRKGILNLVNLNGTSYWTLPPWHSKDNQTHWKGSDIFPLGYRHMCRWFGIKIWTFFEELNAQQPGCNYRHILRIDEDSFILSPIDYDIFDYMQQNEFVYGFRLCAYEMDYNRYIAPWWMKFQAKTPMRRTITKDMCGFYNNFFVADLNFFTSSPVKTYLHQIHRQGFIYRKRYGDLMIHTTAVYAFADPEKVHRFLDFTYQHVTTDHILHPEQGCVVWGGIQAGYNDANADDTLKRYMEEYVSSKRCTANTTHLRPEDLSPTYQHNIPKHLQTEMSLKTITAGRVELKGKGLLSG